MDNSIYGKTTENLRKRAKVRLVTNGQDYEKYVRKPSFASHKIFSKTFVAIYEIKRVLTLDKPIYVGFSILDLSKLLMYKFYYKYIRTKCNNSVKFLFTDTDGLVYELKQMIFIKIFMKIRIFLILVTIHKIQSFLILSI